MKAADLIFFTNDKTGIYWAFCTAADAEIVKCQNVHWCVLVEKRWHVSTVIINPVPQPFSSFSANHPLTHGGCVIPSVRLRRAVWCVWFFIRFILYVASLVGLSAPGPSSSASLKHRAQRRDQTCHCHRYRDAPCTYTLCQRPLCSGTPAPFPDAFTQHLPGGAVHRVTVTQHALSFFLIENELAMCSSAPRAQSRPLVWLKNNK